MNKLNTLLLTTLLAASMLVAQAEQVPNGLSIVTVGTAQSVKYNGEKFGQRSTMVSTTEGRTYMVWGTASGIEGSVLTIETRANGTKELCGGLPRNCYLLMS